MPKNSESFILSLWSSAAWKPVKVELPTTAATRRRAGNDDDKDKDEDDSSSHDGGNNNHYDNPRLIRSAKKDLPVRPGEDVAIFYGLEVLEDYHHHHDGQQPLQQKPSSLSPSEGKERRETKKRKRQNPCQDELGKQEATLESEVQNAAKITATRDGDSNENTKSTNKKKKKKKKARDANKDATTIANTTTTVSTSTSTAYTLEEPSHMKLQEQDNDTSSNNKSITDATHDATNTDAVPVADPEKLLQVSQSWSQATHGTVLNPLLIQSLANQGFHCPTPIQAATLSAAILGRRNLVGAAPTGSGKTLAFLLPILHTLLDQQQQPRKTSSSSSSYVQAVIVTPTRELATQIHAECEKLYKHTSINSTHNCAAVVSLVGGIALVKQKRLLEQKKPSILVGTPGRLWAMISSGENEHLRDLSQVRFLVLDEADRMTQDHSFPQLVQILDALHQANPQEHLQGRLEPDCDESGDGDDDDDDRLLALPGIPGEAPLMMLNDDILQKIEQQKTHLSPETREVGDEELPNYSIVANGLGEEDEDDTSVANDEDNALTVQKRRRGVHRQIFIYSATLTLPFTKTSKPTKVRQRASGLDGAIAEILEKTQATGETKIVDLSSASDSASTNNVNDSTKGVRLPPGLTLEQIKCTQRHKDSHLFAYLVTTVQGASGPCLVFCNSIAAVRRVGTTLQTLGLQVKMLHANMQQRARFKAVESLADSKNRLVVVCTDVAARGLDIPSVSTIVHYDVARTVDMFVHRSGRTARGIGNAAVGSSLSLVSPVEDKAHARICATLQVAFKKVLVDGRLMSAAQERVNLASKIVTLTQAEQKRNSHNKWFLENAKEADLDIDADLLETEEDLSEREVVQMKEARKAKLKLQRLLQEPMKAQKFGKFLSSYGASVRREIDPFVAATSMTKKGKRKRKR